MKWFMDTDNGSKFLLIIVLLCLVGLLIANVLVVLFPG